MTVSTDVKSKDFTYAALHLRETATGNQGRIQEFAKGGGRSLQFPSSPLLLPLSALFLPLRSRAIKSDIYGLGGTVSSPSGVRGIAPI